LGEPADLAVTTNRDHRLLVQRRTTADVYVVALPDPREMVKASLPEPQPPALALPHPVHTTSIKAVVIGGECKATRTFRTAGRGP
jgi:hypothetical protein